MAKIVNGIQTPKKPEISDDDLSLTENPAARSYRHQTHSGAIKHSVQTDHVFEQKTLKEGTATQVFGTQQLLVIDGNNDYKLFYFLQNKYNLAIKK